MTFAQFKKTIPHIKKKMQGWPYKAIIIDGPQGPTGKTTAAKLLREQGLDSLRGLGSPTRHFGCFAARMAGER